MVFEIKHTKEMNKIDFLLALVLLGFLLYIFRQRIRSLPSFSVINQSIPSYQNSSDGYGHNYHLLISSSSSLTDISVPLASKVEEAKRVSDRFKFFNFGSPRAVTNNDNDDGFMVSNHDQTLLSEKMESN